MELKVTDDGVLIPRHLLPDVDAVHVRAEGGVLVIAPAPSVDDEDPILGLGRNPVRGGEPDGSAAHDRYLYGGPA